VTGAARGAGPRSTQRLRAQRDRILFQVRLTPRGGRDAIEGWATAADGTSHLKARVSAAPESGKANDALIALLAEALGVGRSTLVLVSGDRARLKTIAAAGDTAALTAKLQSFKEAT